MDKPGTMGFRTKLFSLWRNLTYSTIGRLFLFFYILFPIILKLFPSIFLHTVFSYKYKGPAVYMRLTNPERDWNFQGASNQYITSQSGNIIGIWHVPPPNAENPSLSKAEKVIIYCHGQSGNRASGHRTLFYKVLTNLGFHVVTFDYSGFGDSTGFPNGRNVELDTISVYAWTIEQLQKTDAIIIVWGHSLGSGIMTYALAEFSTNQHIQPPHGVVLESPFTSLTEASKSSKAFKLFDIMYPLIWRRIFNSSMEKHKIEFNTLKNLPKLSSNILILHAEDDPKVNVRLSQELYDNLMSGSKTAAKSVHFYKIASKYGLGHNLVYSFKHLKDIMTDFTDVLSGKVISEKVRYQQITV
uniref:lysophosphatidylserine lipase ABHD12-like n=1 Tax=Styela clava TaxID=7725 RepID=UPI0019397796|nr:lysophosphatidylserine lipase ABHD12-like [Styela clava]